MNKIGKHVNMHIQIFFFSYNLRYNKYKLCLESFFFYLQHLNVNIYIRKQSFRKCEKSVISREDVSYYYVYL